MNRRTWGILIVALAACGIAAFVRLRAPDDQRMGRMLLGTWRATDPQNAALHRRDDDKVSGEEVVFKAGGTLTYTVFLASDPETPVRDPWEWAVRRGRLYVRFAGPKTGKEWLPSLNFSVTPERLVIRTKGYPPKELVRLGA